MEVNPPEKRRKVRGTKDQFMRLAVIGFGTPAVAYVTWVTGEYRLGIVSWIFLIGLALATAYVAGAWMWKFVIGPMQDASPVARIDPHPALTEDNGLSGLSRDDASTVPEFEYEAVYDEVDAITAERTFVFRSIWTLRRFVTFVPPVVFLSVVAFGYIWTGDSLLFRAAAALLMLDLIIPIFLVVVRLAAAARLARTASRRKIRINSSGITVEAEGRQEEFLWQRIQYVWDAGNYLLLVINPYQSLNLPKRGLPQGVQDVIARKVADLRL